MMTAQEQAFKAYYASMTDAELLQTAANKASFVEIARRLLLEEVERRQLVIPAPPLEPAHMKHLHSGILARLIGKLRHVDLA